MTTNLIAVIASLAIFVFVFDLLRRGILKEKYAVLWLLVAGVGFLFSVIPGALDWIGVRLGIGAPVNLLFFVMGVVLVLVSVQLSFELSRHEARIRRLAEEVALIRESVPSSDVSQEADPDPDDSEVRRGDE
jgi:hypothetical protein